MRKIIACSSCRYAPDQKTNDEGHTGGALLATLLRERARVRAIPVDIATQACFWACKRHCSVLLRDDQRYSYLAADFHPVQEHADAILDWFVLHGKTETGEVPSAAWPEAMRGHFVTRIPPSDSYS